ERVRGLAERLLSAEVDAASAAAFARAALVTCERLLVSEGPSELALALEARAEGLAALVAHADPTLAARAQIVRAMGVSGGDRAEALALMSSAAEALDALG